MLDANMEPFLITLLRMRHNISIFKGKSVFFKRRLLEKFTDEACKSQKNHPNYSILRMWERCLPEKQLPTLPFEPQRGRNNRTRDPLCRWPGTSQFHQSELCTFLDGMIASALYCKRDALSSAGTRGLQALHRLYAVGQAVQCLLSFGARDKM